MKSEKQSKLTIGDKVLMIINVTKLTYNEIFKIEDNQRKVIQQLEEELKMKVLDIINL